MFMWLYVCVCECGMCEWVHVCECRYMSLCECTYVYDHMYMYACECVYVHVCGVYLFTLCWRFE